MADQEDQHPEIKNQIDYYRTLVVPPCPKCRSTDTAKTTGGVIGRTIAIGAATQKVKVVPNFAGGARDAFWCEHCKEFFDAEPSKL